MKTITLAVCPDCSLAIRPECLKDSIELNQIGKPVVICRKCGNEYPAGKLDVFGWKQVYYYDENGG